MSNGYENAVATKMLATNCVCCGRALVDAISVQMGIGPECRSGDNDGIDPDIQKIANEHVFKAALAAQRGRVEEVLIYADLIHKLGLEVLADKVARRFKKAIGKTERRPDIFIEEVDGAYRVLTPFRRGAKKDFIQAWRNIPGRRFEKGANVIPLSQKQALWVLLQKFFGGKYGKGPKGVFRIPVLFPVQEKLKLA